MISVVTLRHSCALGVLAIGVLYAAPAIAKPAVKAAIEKKALVIGNNMYRSTPLRNAVYDAQAMARVLEQNGFAVTLATNLDGQHFRTAIERFASSLTPSTLSVFYYAGHGVQFGGDTLMLPIEVSLRRQQSILEGGIGASNPLKEFGSRAEATIMILDTCRKKLQERGPGAGSLVEVKYHSSNILLVHSTAPGATADDGGPNRHGYFVEALTKVLASGESVWSINALMSQVRAKVIELTGGAQVPWISSSLTSDYWLQPPPSGVTPERDDVSKPHGAQLCAVTARAVRFGCDPAVRECGEDEIRARYLSVRARAISCSPVPLAGGSTDTTVEAQRTCRKMGGRIAALEEVLYAAAAAAAGEAHWVQSPEEYYADRNVLTDTVVYIKPESVYVVSRAGVAGSVRCAVP